MSLWYESNPARLVLEQEAMKRRFPGFQLNREGATLFWLGTLTSNTNKQYQIAVSYPDNFPDVPPKVYPIDPLIAIWRDDRMLQHQYNDGSLCLFHPNDRFWESKTTAATVIATAAAWFFAYERWLESGRQTWPGLEAH